MKYMVFVVRKALKIICITFVGTFVLRIFDLGGHWSVTLKNRGRSQKTDW